jgi:hypothetical protein
MSIVDRLFRRGRREVATVEPTGPKMTKEEALAKRAALWLEMQRNPTPQRAAEIAQEASNLLQFFGRDHPMYDNINELIRVAHEAATGEKAATR